MASSLSSPSSLLKTRLIALWFALQVVINIVVAVFITLNPPDEPVSWFGRVDLIINTGINTALAIGFWWRRRWSWSLAVVLIPLYWTLHIWHMVVPEEGLLLWPFLSVDALILLWLLRPGGRKTFGAPPDRFRPIVFVPPVMGALAVYAATVPFLGLFVAAPVALAVAGVGWKWAIKDSKFKIQE